MRIGTLFSGIGAPETALKEMQVKHEVAFACDIDDRARRTYTHNHKAECLFSNICTIDALPSVDLLVFGFPCQPFSTAGHQRGLADDRGRLVLEAIRLLRQSQPRMFVAENVSHLVKLDDGKPFASILRRLRSAGYTVSWAVLNSLDFGVPQHRQRVWIVGRRQDLPPRPYTFPKSVAERQPLAKLLDVLPRNESGHRFFATEEFLAKPKVQKALANYQHDYTRCLTGAIARSGSSAEYISYVAAVNRAIGQLRKPTPRECLRLHGFPENFHFAPDSKATAQYYQAANTMTVPVVRAIFERLLQ